MEPEYAELIVEALEEFIDAKINLHKDGSDIEDAVRVRKARKDLELKLQTMEL